MGVLALNCSAVLARSDMHFDVNEESMNAEKFINFLQNLRQDTGCPIFVIADNARYHHRKKYRCFWKLNSARL